MFSEFDNVISVQDRNRMVEYSLESNNLVKTKVYPKVHHGFTVVTSFVNL